MSKKQVNELTWQKLPVLVNFGNNPARRATFEDYKIPYKEVDKFPEGQIPDTLFRSEVTYLTEK